MLPDEFPLLYVKTLAELHDAFVNLFSLSAVRAVNADVPSEFVSVQDLLCRYKGALPTDDVQVSEVRGAYLLRPHCKAHKKLPLDLQKFLVWSNGCEIMTAALGLMLKTQGAVPGELGFGEGLSVSRVVRRSGRFVGEMARYIVLKDKGSGRAHDSRGWHLHEVEPGRSHCWLDVHTACGRVLSADPTIWQYQPDAPHFCHAWEGQDARYSPDPDRPVPRDMDHLTVKDLKQLLMVNIAVRRAAFRPEYRAAQDALEDWMFGRLHSDYTERPTVVAERMGDPLGTPSPPEFKYHAWYALKPVLDADRGRSEVVVARKVVAGRRMDFFCQVGRSRGTRDRVIVAYSDMPSIIDPMQDFDTAWKACKLAETGLAAMFQRLGVAVP